MSEHPRLVETHDNKSVIVDHVAVSTVTVTRGQEITLGIALDVDGRLNKTRRRAQPTLVIPVEKLHELVVEMTYHGSAAHREFAGELENAIRVGHEKLLKEGAPR